MLSLTDFKYWLQIKPVGIQDQEALDTFLQNCIDEAISTAEDICNQKLAYGKSVFVADYSRKDGLKRNTIFLYFPVDKITKIQYVNGNGITDIITANEAGIIEGLYVDKVTGFLKLLNGYYFKKEVNMIELYHGYTVNNVPKSLQKNIKLLATMNYNNSEYALSRFGLSSRNMNASGSSGLSFRSDDEILKAVEKELQNYKYISL